MLMCSLFSLVLANSSESGPYFPISDSLGPAILRHKYVSSLYLYPYSTNMSWNFSPSMSINLRRCEEATDARKVGQIGISGAGQNGITRVRGAESFAIVCCNLQTNTDMDSRIQISIYIFRQKSAIWKPLNERIYAQMMSDSSINLLVIFLSLWCSSYFYR